MRHSREACLVCLFFFSFVSLGRIQLRRFFLSLPWDFFSLSAYVQSAA